jgi:hypothetical protein
VVILAVEFLALMMTKFIFDYSVILLIFIHVYVVVIFCVVLFFFNKYIKKAALIYISEVKRIYPEKPKKELHKIPEILVTKGGKIS